MITKKQALFAWQDLKDALKMWPVWRYMSMLELHQRYRRSVLGPWWISISMAVFIGAMGVVYSRLFHQNMATYVPFFTTGFLFWNFIASGINEASDIFKNSSGYIRQIKLPYLFYLFKNCYRQTLFLMHNFIVYIAVVVIYRVSVFHESLLLFIPGFLLLQLNLLWISLLIGIVGTRFRDIVPLVASIVQIAFFISPITWMPKLVGENSLIIKLNPVMYLLDVVRSPLLGEPVKTLSWIVVVGMAFFGSAVTFFMFAKYRERIAFWVE